MKLSVIKVDGFWHLNIVRNSSIFVAYRGLSSVLEKFPPSNLPPRKIVPRKIAPPPPKKKKEKLQNYRPPPPSPSPPQKKEKEFCLFLILFYYVFCSKFNFSQYIFLIRIKFFYNFLFPYLNIFGFQQHKAK